MGKYLDMIRAVERQKAERGAFVASVASVATPNNHLATTEESHRDDLQTRLLGDKSDKSDKRVSSSPFAGAFTELKSRCPDYLDAERWQQAMQDANCLLPKWGRQAEALGWTADELFGLHPVPARPAPSYCRLSRYDCTGLLWLLQGRHVIALTANTAVIATPSGGTLTYPKLRKPAYGPIGDSLDNFTQSTTRSAGHVTKQERQMKQMTECSICKVGECKGYFGLCPVCHETDGYANAGRSHRFYCKEHKTSWCAGSNLFSSWRYQTEAEQRAIWDEIGLNDFEDVEPYIPLLRTRTKRRAK